MTAPVRIVVVDSGVDPGHPLVRGRCRFVAGPAFGDDGAPVPGGGGVDLLGHGTAVAATLLQFGAEVELVSLRVFDADATAPFGRVLAALEHAATLAPALINVSLGTTSLRHRERLLALLAAAAASGSRIVAPASYGGLPCDPGNLAGVEAVVADPNALPALPRLRRHAERWLWYASPLPPRDQDGGRRLTARGDSLAVANVTGFLASRPRP